MSLLHPHFSDRQNRNRAFTLIELLTLVAVLGILICLAVAALGNVRALSHMTKCAANLRQIGVAGMVFIEEHNGMFSSSRLYNSIRNPDEPGLREYFADDAEHPVFTCPALARYGVAHTYTLALVATNNTKPGNRALVYRNRVEYPSRTAWMLDGTWMDNSPSRSWFSSYMIPADSDLARLVYPHKNKENVLFVDGHVELLDKEALKDRNAQIWSGFSR